MRQEVISFQLQMGSGFLHVFYRIRYSFPIQLLVVHLKHNQLLLLFWLILFAFVTRSFGNDFGIPYLFLDPEYLGRVGFLSWFVLGICCGAFVVAFHIASYIVNSSRFPFLAALSRPFLKYTWNNSLIPLLFMGFYSYNVIVFQYRNEFSSLWGILAQLSGLYLGLLVFYVLSLGYFITVSKDVFKIFGVDVLEKKDRRKTRRIQMAGNEWKRISHKEHAEHVVHVDNYFSDVFTISLARDTSHYDTAMIKAVFLQNHSVAAIFEIAIVLLIFLMGYFRDVPAILIPAGGSIFLSFTMLLMLASAFHNWLKGWSISLFILIGLGINFLSAYASFGKRSQAFGLDYKQKGVDLSDNLKDVLSSTTLCRDDSLEGIRRLENWKKTAFSADSGKPAMVLLNVSGGGIKAAMWTLIALQHADHSSKGKLFRNTHLITGSSGGMIGAAYFRELYLQQRNQQIPSCYSPEYAERISRDMLNPISFSLAVSDVFFRAQQEKVGKYYYTRDRGFEFERALHENTANVLNKRLIDYREAEQAAIIPTMIFTPTVINDGRRMMISAQPLGFLSLGAGEIIRTLPEDIEFMRFFREQGAEELRFSTAIRMSATFPYILPAVALPSKPVMEVMDAGFRDNFGIRTTLRYLFYFKDWIEANTSGIVILQVRENHKTYDLKTHGKSTLLESVISPLGNVYENLFRIQDYSHEQLLAYARAWYNGRISLLELDLNPNLSGDDDIISMSFHLTSLEKGKIRKAIWMQENQETLRQLSKLISYPINEQPLHLKLANKLNENPR
jgi:hypothetical protein